MFFERFLKNHVLANLFFILVLTIGFLSYASLPRQQDPSINFNWINISTVLPGASAEIIEQKVTQILEEGLETVKDIKFVSSISRQNISSILIRFNDIDASTFEKRIQDIRRTLQNKRSELPSDATEPDVFEVTSSNAFPSATVIVTADNNDESLRLAAKQLRREISRLKRVDRVNPTGLSDPQINIEFDPDQLQKYELNVTEIATSLQQAMQDVSAGDINLQKSSWLVTLKGPTTNLEEIANIPIQTTQGEIPLSLIASASRGRSDPGSIVSFKGKPGIMLAVTKKDNSNTLLLVDEVKELLRKRNALSNNEIHYHLADDQTQLTLDAISVMENNFLIGLVMVLIVTGLFLGGKVALMTTLGIPFTVAGTFWALSVLGFTLNTSVLLAIVIALGMLVDDAVVVVESIYSRLRKNQSPIKATIDGISEVIAPVTTSVLTTIAAFLPLMLLPGILGKFLLVVPLVVTLALLISLIEAYWLLPAHVTMMKLNLNKPNRIGRMRNAFLKKIQTSYSKALIKFMRFPKTVLLFVTLLLFGSGASLAMGYIKLDFFASDTLRIYYINVKMPSDSSLENTMKVVNEVKGRAEKHLLPEETRSVVGYAGQLFTETEPLFGKQYGQLLVSLVPKGKGLRSVEEVIASMRKDVTSVQGAQEISILKLAGGPPAGKDISLKILGDDYSQIREATDALKDFILKNKEYVNVNDDDTPGTWGLNLKIDYEKARLFNISPQLIIFTLNALVDGIIVTNTFINNEFIDVRLQARQDRKGDDIKFLLEQTLTSPTGDQIILGELLKIETQKVKGNIRHYNFQRAITIEADIDKSLTDTLKANEKIRTHWESIAKKYPELSIDNSGALDDIQESLNSILTLFIFGIGLMYMILGTQFRSYFQPFLVLFAVPLAFIGVIVGLLLTKNPLSLFTLYGIVALSGIAVNAAIVLVATANRYRSNGMSPTLAIFYASRRRIIPIIITTLTTIAGLISLAIGIGGKSLIWGPVATAIVSGLSVSSILSVFTIPILYLLTSQRTGFFRKSRPKKPIS